MIKKTEEDIINIWKVGRQEPLVSIVCITYNVENYIEEAMDSFLSQNTTFPFEIIVGEDHGQDRTLDILLTYQEKFPNIVKIIVHSKNMGRMKNSIRAIQSCRGKYLAFCDGDDYWTDANKLQIQYDEMKKYNVDMSFHSVVELIGMKTGKVINKYEENMIFTSQEVIMGDGGFCSASTTMIKAETLKELSRFENIISVQDYIIQILGSVRTGALYIDKCMSIYRKGRLDSGTVMDSKLSYMEMQNKIYSTIKMYEELNILFGNDFNNVFLKRKSYSLYHAALWCLRNNDIQRYRKYIVKSHQVYNLKFIRYLLGYYLRFLPRRVLLNFAPGY